MKNNELCSLEFRGIKIENLISGEYRFVPRIEEDRYYFKINICGDKISVLSYDGSENDFFLSSEFLEHFSSAEEKYDSLVLYCFWVERGKTFLVYDIFINENFANYKAMKEIASSLGLNYLKSSSKFLEEPKDAFPYLAHYFKMGQLAYIIPTNNIDGIEFTKNEFIPFETMVKSAKKDPLVEISYGEKKKEVERIFGYITNYLEKVSIDLTEDELKAVKILAVLWEKWGTLFKIEEIKKEYKKYDQSFGFSEILPLMFYNLWKNKEQEIFEMEPKKIVKIISPSFIEKVMAEEFGFFSVLMGEYHA
jgi:hypothetical protein